MFCSQSPSMQILEAQLDTVICSLLSPDLLEGVVPSLYHPFHDSVKLGIVIPGQHKKQLSAKNDLMAYISKHLNILTAPVSY